MRRPRPAQAVACPRLHGRVMVDGGREPPSCSFVPSQPQRATALAFAAAAFPWTQRRPLLPARLVPSAPSPRAWTPPPLPAAQPALAPGPGARHLSLLGMSGVREPDPGQLPSIITIGLGEAEAAEEGPRRARRSAGLYASKPMLSVRPSQIPATLSTPVAMTPTAAGRWKDTPSGSRSVCASLASLMFLPMDSQTAASAIMARP